MEKLSFKLSVFEGPLDALLYLISKNKLNIYDVSISELLDQYLEYLNEMREMNLEITSEFLEMASRLVQIKSSMLLPRDENEKSEEKQFLQALIEYKTCKEMAAALRERDEGFGCYTRDALVLENTEPYSTKHKVAELKKAYLMLGNKVKSKRPPTVDNFKGVVGVKTVSIISRVIHVIKRLIKGGKRSLDSLYDDVHGRSEAVATFLAVLELIRSKKIAVSDDNMEVRMLKRKK